MSTPKTYYKSVNFTHPSGPYLIDGYGFKNLIMGKINDSRLTSDMNRTRSGSTQMFRRDYGDRKFTSEENADVILRHELKNYYAEFIEGEWYWVNGCYECAGDKRDWMCYSTCETHDVCRTCRCSRAVAKTCWGGKEGWECASCHDTREQLELEEAIANTPEYDEWDYRGLSQIKCPHCSYEYDYPESYEHIEADDKDMNCPRCKGKFCVTAHQSVTFDITMEESL